MVKQMLRESGVGGTSAARPNTGEAIRTTAGVFAAVVLSGIFPLLLVEQIPDVGRNDAWYVTLGIMVLGGLRLALFINKGEARLFEFIVWLFTYVFFGLAASVQFRSGRMPGTTPGLNPALDLPSTSAIVIGLATFVIGVWWARLKPPRAARNGLPKEPSKIDVRRANWLLVIGSCAAIYYVSQIGLNVIFGNRTAQNQARAAAFADGSVGSIVKALATYPILVASHALFQARKSRDQSTGKNVGKKRALLSAVGVMALVNPIGSARYGFGSVWGSFLVPLGAYATKIRTSMSMLGIIFGLLVIFPIADAFRRASGGPRVSREGFFDEYAGNGDYDALGQISNALAFVTDQGITWGSQLLGVLFFWVPRSVWPDKAMDTGVLLAEFRGYRFTNLSSPLWAEALVNFGLVGVVVLFLAFGYAVGKLDQAGTTALKSGGFAVLPMSIIPFYLLILLRGSLLQATGGLAVMITCMLFVRKKGSLQPKAVKEPLPTWASRSRVSQRLWKQP
ncbi:O-antigen polymerase [Pseudarthrobacter siccitolerans]